MLRFIVVILVVAIYFIIGVPAFAVIWLVGLVSMKTRDKMSKGIIWLYLKGISFLSGVKLTVKGLDNVPKDRSVLYVGNHQGFFDVILTYPIMPGQIGFIAKKEFEKIPILSWAMKLIHCRFLDRQDIKQGLKVILAAIEDVKKGISIFIFPEGTRSRDGAVAEFKEGSMKIATKSGCPIIPVAFSNTSAVFEDEFPKIRAVPVIIEFGKPINPTELDKDELKHLGAKVRDIVVEMKDTNDKELGL